MTQSVVLFQSTLPRGERRRARFPFLLSNPISIHAPARGATLLCFTGIVFQNSISIHAPARGATILPMITGIFQKEFQSTLPRGERRIVGNLQRQPERFQSTLPRGERPMLKRERRAKWKFQSTLPRGERRWPPPRRWPQHNISIHAPARGATKSLGGVPNPASRFQSTLPRGERR